MPICLDRESRPGLFAGSDGLPENSPVEFHEPDPNCITIGLINNMPDPALQSTERQFVALLGAAADGIVVRLKPYALPDVPRTEWGRDYVSRFYSRLDDLWDSHLEGLIVTGTEPRLPNLRDEPYWGSLIRVLEWAEDNTHSTVCSCLATHAALLHLDGIDRRPLNDKRFGVFECVLSSAHSRTRIRLPQYGSSRRFGKRGSVPVTIRPSRWLSHRSSSRE